MDTVRQHHSTRHGHTRGGRTSPTWRSWNAMHQRCEQPSHEAFARYGGRGIRVCDRWRVFENFLADMGIRPEGMSIDRIDPNGHYEPSNCRWATRTEQARNRRDTVKVIANGVVESAAAVTARLGLTRDRVASRLSAGMSNERAVSPRDLRGTNQPRAHVIEFDGKRMNRAEWERHLGLPKDLLRHRFERGWSIAEALTKPARKMTKRIAAQGASR